MPEADFMKVGIYRISFHLSHHNREIHKSFIRLYMCILPTGAKQRLGKHFPTAPNIYNNRTFQRVFFYAVCVASQESL
jgi:hypothetical protein